MADSELWGHGFNPEETTGIQPVGWPGGKPELKESGWGIQKASEEGEETLVSRRALAEGEETLASRRALAEGQQVGGTSQNEFSSETVTEPPFGEQAQAPASNTTPMPPDPPASNSAPKASETPGGYNAPLNSRDAETVVLPAITQPYPLERQFDTGYSRNAAPVTQPQQDTYTAVLPAKDEKGYIYRNNGRRLTKSEDPTPIVMKTVSGEMTLTLDHVSIRRYGSEATRHGSDYVQMPLTCISTTDLIQDTDKDGNTRVAAWFDVVLPDGTHNQEPESTEEASKDAYSFEVSNIAEAKAFLAEVDKRIQKARVPMPPEDLPIRLLSTAKKATMYVVVAVLAVATLLCGYFALRNNHPATGGNTKALTSEVSSLKKQVEDLSKQRDDANAKANKAQQDADNANKAKAEAEKKLSELQQSNAQQSATAQSIQNIINSNPPLSRQALLDNAVAQGISQSDAEAAINQLGINFQNNANSQAQTYRNANPTYSKQQIQDMLTQAGFTQQEAQQAVQGISDAQTQSQNSNSGQDSPTVGSSEESSNDTQSWGDKAQDLYNGVKDTVGGLL